MFWLKQQWVEVTYTLFITIATAVCIKERSDRHVSSMGLRSGSLLVHGLVHLTVSFPHCTYYHHNYREFIYAGNVRYDKPIACRYMRTEASILSAYPEYPYLWEGNIVFFMSGVKISFVFGVKIMPTAALPEIINSC